MDLRRPLLGLSSAELGQLMVELEQPAYRSKQIAGHIYQKFATDFEQMKDLPKELRVKLEAGFRVSPIQVSSHKKSTDGVEKLLVHNGDDQVYECVLLPYTDRVSCCLSTQVGCPMGCTFCATGMGGFDRNLTANEIVAQFHLLQSLSPRRISHIVFMGMGEPLLNLDAVLKSMEIFTGEIGLSYRHLTISTVGLVPQINILAEKNLPIHLALSLHSPLDEVRSKLMPVNQKWPVAVVMGAMKDYYRATKRKITIEYLLIDGVNDTPEESAELANLVKGIPTVVNIIPWNWVDTGQGFARPSRETVRRFKQDLKNRGVNVTERVERGHDIAAACGQLAGQHQGRFAKRRSLWEIPVTKT